MAGYKPRVYIISSLVPTDDGALVQATVSIPFPSMSVNQFRGRRNTLQMLKLKNLQLEITETVNLLDTEADHFILTITPNSAASHPVITDPDCLFKHAEYIIHDGTAANSRKEFLIKSFKLKDAYISKSQFYIQVSLDMTAAGSIYFKFEYEVINVTSGQMSVEALRSGYITA